MFNQIVYLRGSYIRAQRQGLRADQPHALDAHHGRHVVRQVYGGELLLESLHAPGTRISVPASAVWRTGERACDLP